MKTNKLKMMLAGVVALVSIQVQAQDFGGKNGGDPMELQFQEVAADIQQWILKGGAQALVLPPDVIIQDYQSKMLSAISAATVSFTTETILVNGVEKACMNQPASKLIQCNVDRFKSASESQRYVLVHHEYAGLAGLETNTGAKSDYSISDQITGSLEKTIVLKLAVKKSTQNGENIVIIKDPLHEGTKLPFSTESDLVGVCKSLGYLGFVSRSLRYKRTGEDTVIVDAEGNVVALPADMPIVQIACYKY